MEILRESAAEPHAIFGCGERGIRLRDRDVTGPVIVTREAVLEDWRPPELAALSIDDFAALIALAPEVVLLGTGTRQRLPDPSLYAAFAGRGIGLEAMDNRAACRTYNLLLGEYRAVAAALLF